MDNCPVPQATPEPFRMSVKKRRSTSNGDEHETELYYIDQNAERDGENVSKVEDAVARGQAVSSNEKIGKTNRYWTPDEHQRFLEGLKKFGYKNVKSIADHVQTRSATQVRTHAQKYFQRLERLRQRQLQLENGSLDPGVQRKFVRRQGLPDGWTEHALEQLRRGAAEHAEIPDLHHRIQAIADDFVPEHSVSDVKRVYYQMFLGAEPDSFQQGDEEPYADSMPSLQQPYPVNSQSPSYDNPTPAKKVERRGRKRKVPLGKRSNDIVGMDSVPDLRDSQDVESDVLGHVLDARSIHGEHGNENGNASILREPPQNMTMPFKHNLNHSVFGQAPSDNLGLSSPARLLGLPSSPHRGGSLLDSRGGDFLNPNNMLDISWGSALLENMDSFNPAKAVLTSAPSGGKEGTGG